VDLEMELCGETLFNHSDLEEIKWKGIDNYYCVKNKTMLKMGGSFLADVYQSIVISLNPC